MRYIGLNFKYIIIILIFTNKFVLAAVNMKTASFNETWVDLKLTTGDKFYLLERKYNSRSLYYGVFGLGWCSNIEDHLVITENSIKLIECSNFMMPTEFTKSKKNSSIFYNKNNKDERMVETRSYYILYRATFEILKFSKSGQLILTINKNGDSISFNYKNKRLTSINNSSGEELKIKYSKSHAFISYIEDSNGLKTEYFYNDQNLIKIKKHPVKVDTLKYDDNNNLTEISGDKNLKIYYDTDKDQALKVVENNQCEQIFQFEIVTPLHNISSVKHICSKQLVRQLRYDFYLEKNSFSAVPVKVILSESGKKFILLDKSQLSTAKQRNLSGSFKREL